MAYSQSAALLCQALILTMTEHLDTLILLMAFKGFTFVGKVAALLYLLEVSPTT